MRLLCILIYICFANTYVTSEEIKLLVIKEKEENVWDKLEGSMFNEQQIIIDREDENGTMSEVCKSLKGGLWGVIDMSWTGVENLNTICENSGVIYLRVENEIIPFMRAVDRFLTDVRTASDAALIFQKQEQVEQMLYYMIEESVMRVAIFTGFNHSMAAQLQNMRPTPSFNVIFGETKFIKESFQLAQNLNLVKRDDRWILVFTDTNFEEMDKSTYSSRVNIATINTTSCCVSGNEKECACPIDMDIKSEFTYQLKSVLTEALTEIIKQGIDISPVSADCEEFDVNSSKNTTLIDIEIKKAAEKSWAVRYIPHTLTPELSLTFKSESSIGSQQLASWASSSELKKENDISPVKRFFRVATGYSVPFAYPLEDRKHNKILDLDGAEIWEGYCIDLIDQLSKDMKFEYELVTSYDFGRKLENGSWSGLVGELQSGRVDIVIGALTMTSEREEVIDFVAPYFEQTGFSIVIRKPLRKTSLFKFMTVLRVEVWFSILAALCLTAVMVWFLDKYSPYSARNNKQKYPYPCREFTLRESFWFAVTSFTPQGGGEAPKSLSARTLVAAYWLFVVLMLATFTANLAAFLTVERMQSPVQSLKQLARQSRINYTVVQDSDAHAYFRNMKHAEETLYRVWKDITLNSSADQAKYRVWDYPIKEQYGHILIAMEKTGTVATAEEGFKKVKDNEEAEFALIHDALEIKYEVYQNCNLTEIGEPFAEQPYSIAVQQGSHLNEEISRRILDLQRDRYFESLSAKYWNSTRKGKCDSFDEDEGITLESLGGVFIATLFGLLLAMLTLGAEVLYQKKKNKTKIKSKDDSKINKIIRDEIITSKEFGHNVKKKTSLLNPKPRVSFITVYPKDQLF